MFRGLQGQDACSYELNVCSLGGRSVATASGWPGLAGSGLRVSRVLVPLVGRAAHLVPGPVSSGLWFGLPALTLGASAGAASYVWTAWSVRDGRALDPRLRAG